MMHRGLLHADLVTRPVAAKMAALGGIAGSQNRLTSFFQRTTALLAEAEQSIYAFFPYEDLDKIEMLQERLSEAGETVFIFKREQQSEISSLTEQPPLCLPRF